MNSRDKASLEWARSAVLTALGTIERVRATNATAFKALMATRKTNVYYQRLHLDQDLTLCCNYLTEVATILKPLGA